VKLLDYTQEFHSDFCSNSSKLTFLFEYFPYTLYHEIKKRI